MKEKILNEIECLVAGFCYYDRKEDEDLSSEDLNEAFKKGDITIDEMVEKFREGLNDNFK